MMAGANVTNKQKPAAVRSWKDRLTLRMDAEFQADVTTIGLDPATITGADVKQLIHAQAELRRGSAASAVTSAAPLRNLPSDAGLTWSGFFYDLFNAMPDSILKHVSAEQLKQIEAYEAFKEAQAHVAQ